MRQVILPPLVLCIPLWPLAAAEHTQAPALHGEGDEDDTVECNMQDVIHPSEPFSCQELQQHRLM